MTFKYDANVPSGLRWRCSGWGRAGTVAGQRYRGGYLVQVDGRLYNCARIVWERHNGPLVPGYKVIFIDRNYRNTKIENLAIVPMKVEP